MVGPSPFERRLTRALAGRGVGFMRTPEREASGCAVSNERGCTCTLKDKKRLVACGGREAGWVTAMPAVREYQLTNNQWRDSVSTRLHVPLSFLVAGPTRCDCHDSFDRRTGDIAQGVAGTAPPYAAGIPADSAAPRSAASGGPVRRARAALRVRVLSGPARLRTGHA